MGFSFSLANILTYFRTTKYSLGNFGVIMYFYISFLFSFQNNINHKMNPRSQIFFT
jgi:hypothetical protein